MKFTRYITSTTAGAVALGAFTAALFANNSDSTSKVTGASTDPLFKRGEYIVHNLGLCIDCHSPRGERGAFIEGKHLTGSPLGFTPTVPMPAWAPVAPPIAGLPKGWTKDHMVQYLMTGTRPHNLPPTMPPMPEYRMNEEDAKAVAQYLEGLGQPK